MSGIIFRKYRYEAHLKEIDDITIKWDDLEHDARRNKAASRSTLGSYRTNDIVRWKEI